MMVTSDPITRPVLTMPAAEAELLRQTYAGARVVLEYGSGGSTLIAAEAAATVFSVESDADWAAMMCGWFAANPAPGRVEIVHADVGPTKEWGMPVDDRRARHWPGYATGVWDRADFEHPDVVLVDGRFRVGCLLTTAFRISRPVTVLFDDYAGRPPYHQVERLVQPTAIVGRMARFDLAPRVLEPALLGWYVQTLMQPR